MNLTKFAKKLVQNKRDKKTQKVRLDFIILSLNLSVFFIYWLVLPSYFLLPQIRPKIFSKFAEFNLTEKQKSPKNRAF
ncbi:TPA: hypothetical protein ACGO5D_002279, partial [Streptococcus suis]